MNTSNYTVNNCCSNVRFILYLIFNNWKHANGTYETTGNLNIKLSHVEMEFLSFSP